MQFQIGTKRKILTKSLRLQFSKKILVNNFASSGAEEKNSEPLFLWKTLLEICQNIWEQSFQFSIHQFSHFRSRFSRVLTIKLINQGLKWRRICMSILPLLLFIKHIYEVVKITIQPMTTVFNARLDGRFEKIFFNKW